MSKKNRIFTIIQIGQDKDIPSRLFDIVVITAILSNLVIAVVETFEFAASLQHIFGVIELLTVLFFTVEYILRLWTADLLYSDLPPQKAVLEYATSFSGVVDLLSFLPYYLPIFFPAGLIAFRMFRVIRILRLFRVNAYYDALNVIADVVKSKRDQLLSSIFIILVLMIAASLCMYSLEHEVQPDVFRNAFSGFWWSVSTLLTVGYGDIYPVTPVGRLFGICITFLGVGMVAIPTGILSAGFVEQYTRVKDLSDYSEESNVRFVRLLVGEGHPWADKTVKELHLPPGLLISVIQRGDEVIVPRGSTVLLQGDQLLLAAEGHAEDMNISLKEITLREHHPWAGHMVKELDISRQTLLVMVRRGENVLIPHGSTRLQPGDTVLLYSKHHYPNAAEYSV